MTNAHQTYVPAPMQQSAPMLSWERTDKTAQNLELTVPLFYQANTARDSLVGAYGAANNSQVGLYVVTRAQNH